MLKRILLLLCIAFAVVCYGFPCFVLPFGEYKGSQTLGSMSSETSYKFKFNGEVSVYSKTTIGDVSTEDSSVKYYKLDKNYVVISDDKTFDDDDQKIKLGSMYLLDNCQNNIGMYLAIGVGALATILVLIPNKRK